jgi:type II secretory pathway pseudopilin PulG
MISDIFFWPGIFALVMVIAGIVVYRYRRSVQREVRKDAEIQAAKKTREMQDAANRGPRDSAATIDILRKGGF